MSRNVIVYDNELKTAALNIHDYCVALTELINKYMTSLQYVTEHAIQDTLISEKLYGLADRVRQIQTPLEEVAEQVKETVNAYISEIDDADQFLF